MNAGATISNSYDSLAKMIRPDQVGFIVSLNPRRLGGRAFLTFLEYRFFTPGTPLNGEFSFAMLKWQEMIFGVALIPRGKRESADVLFKELGLRAANGVPHLFDNTGSHHFPIDLPNLFTIENRPGHFVYQNDPALEKTAYDFEDEACNAVIQAHNESRKNRG